MNQFTLSFLVRQLGIRTSLFQTLHTLFGDLIVQYVPCSETTTIDSHGCVVWTYTFCVQDVDLPSGIASVCAITPDVLTAPYMNAVAPLYFEDSDTVDVQGNGSSILPYSFHVIIDPDTDNALESRANGLFATDSTLNLVVEDEGGQISTAPVTSLNFIGDGVLAAESAPGQVNITIPGGGGGGGGGGGLTDIIQAVVREYNPSAKQALTTSYADVNGSDYSFTPVSATSTIVYTYKFQIAQDNADTIFSVSTKLQVDGVDETESATVHAGGDLGGGLAGYDFVDYTYAIQSWGTTAKTIKMRAKENQTNTETALHSTTVEHRRAVLTITEYA